MRRRLELRAAPVEGSSVLWSTLRLVGRNRFDAYAEVRDVLGGVRRTRVELNIDHLLHCIAVAGGVQLGFALGNIRGQDAAWHRDNRPRVASHAWSPNVDGVHAFTQDQCECERELDEERRAAADDVDF